MSGNPAEHLKIECAACNHKKIMSIADLEKVLGYEIKVTTINTFYEKLTCSKCSGKTIRVSDANNRLLIDPEHYSECQQCGLAIEYPRIQALPETNICAQCASDASGERFKMHQPEPIQFDAERIPASLKKCPSCNSKTILRMNRRTQDRFIGCSRFPRCRWTSSVSENVERKIG